MTRVQSAECRVQSAECRVQSAECRKNVGINSPMSRSTRKNTGFTLVELSIVIVVIGLLAAGVVAGSSVVKQAKLRKVVTDVNNYRAAIQAFKLQYNGLPGDIINASAYWPSCDGTPSNCNGNNNRQIDSSASDSKNEIYRIFQQLSSSGLIPGNYTGIGYGGTIDAIAGTNVPIGPFSGSVYYIIYEGNFLKNPENVIQFVNTKATGVPNKSALTPSDAHSIDKKLDDGLPDLGNIGAYWAGADGFGDDYCRIAGTPSTYELTETRVTCRLGFAID